ncbi:MAG: hypothetical protein HC808_14725 [Candidatus Competibacteraceae bacterium]|nr:hypothetical protein [Candidatus Competibacteraceae bacterium]
MREINVIALTMPVDLSSALLIVHLRGAIAALRSSEGIDQQLAGLLPVNES